MLVLYSIIAVLLIGCATLLFMQRAALTRARLSEANLSALKKSAAAERKDAAFYRIACSDTDDGLVIQGLDGRILWVNPAYCDIMGYPAEEVLGRNPMEFAMRPEDKPSDDFIKNFQYKRDDPNWGRLSLYRSVRKDGEEFWNQIRVSYHQDVDGGEYVILVCRDVTEEVDRESQLREKSDALAHVAAHDDLTGAANRANMMQFTQAALENAKQNGSMIGLLQIDLDKFKDVNDTYGHSAGDAVLRHITDHISRTLRKTDLLARMGGDEFVAVCTQFSSVEELKRLGVALVDSVKEPLIFEGHKIVPSISIGAAISERGGTDVDDLLKRADYALYKVKRAGRGHVAVYDKALHKSVQRKSRRSDELQRAILNDQITFQFQPTIEIATGRICSLEALARWTDADGVTHDAEDFLDMARDLGNLAHIDTAAMKAAVALQAQVNEAGIKKLITGFNASEDFFAHTDYLSSLQSSTRKHRVDAPDLRIELPQSLVFGAQAGDTKKSEVISDLHAAGFGTILDSFDAGFAGLLQMGALNMSGFKTAPQFSQALAESTTTQKAMRMINELAADMSLVGIVLGIESQDAYDALTAAGALYAQGNWIAAPIPAEDVIDWLKTHQSTDGSANILHRQLPPDQRIAI